MTCPRLHNTEAMDLRFSLTSDSRPLFISLDYLTVTQTQTSTISTSSPSYLTPISHRPPACHVQQQILGPLPSRSNHCYHLHCCHPDLSHHCFLPRFLQLPPKCSPCFPLVLLSSVFNTEARINLLKHKS